MHDGKNARVWVQIKVGDNILASQLPDGSIQPALTKGTTLFTRVLGENTVRVIENSVAYNQIKAAQPLIFETIETADNLYCQHNEMHFYTWGARDCTLPTGATSATLCDAFPHLQVGDVLIFQEMMSPRTGEVDGAEPTHRCAVRLTKVTVTKDPLGKLLLPPSSLLPEPVIVEEYIEEDDETIVERKRRGKHEKRGRHDRHGRSGKREKREERMEEEKERRGKKEHRDKQVDEDDEDDLDSTMKLRAIQFHHQEGSQESVRLHARQEPRRGRTKKLTHHSLHEKKHEREEREEKEKKEEREERERRRAEQEKKEEQEVDISERITAPLSLEEPVAGEEITGKERIVIEEHIEQHRRVREIERRVVEEVTIEEEPDYSVDITEIEWAFEDALPFPLCISATTDYEHGHQYLENVSVALGNIVLADHGQQVCEKTFATVPCPTLNYARSLQNQCDEGTPSVPVPPRFYPSLSQSPLTHSVPYDESNPPASATETLNVLSHMGSPVITLKSYISDNSNADGNAPMTMWTPKRDLLNSEPSDTCFVTESEADGTTYIRFGDGQYGARPEPNSSFEAYYRIGNGVSGNIGADSIAHILNDDTRIIGVNNPLPAQGGREPETIDSVRLNVPGVFQKQERAVTPQDAKMLAEMMPNVRRANAQLRWTGSWYTLFVAVELLDDTPANEKRLRQAMERFRMAGSDMVIVQPVYVPLEITMNVTIQAGYIRASVHEALLEVFSNRLWPDGQRGLFAPENITFGQSVYLNTLLGAAHAVSGVDTVEIETFQRLGISGNGLETGELTMDWLELARLDNDPAHPENGIIHLNVRGEQ